MPEWFKGSDLRSDSESFVGSNPTSSKEYFYFFEKFKINLLRLN